MRELTVRALLHSAALGDAGARSAAALLAADIDNPQLHALSRAPGGPQTCCPASSYAGWWLPTFRAAAR